MDEEIRFTRRLEDVILDEVGVDVILECELSKDGMKVEWFKGRKKIRPNLKRVIYNDGRLHRLTIKNVSSKDAGMYYAEFPRYKYLKNSAMLFIKGTVDYSLVFLVTTNTRLTSCFRGQPE